MKILHIWNTAGVASVLAKYQSKVLGWHTWVITRRSYDRYGLTIYGEALKTGTSTFVLKALSLARKFDVIHVHSLDKIVPLFKLIYPSKPLILHYHGSDIRNKWELKKKIWKKADLILVSTPDLLSGAPENVVYLPNPVDTELFRPVHGSKNPNSALYIIKRQAGERIDWAYEVAEKLGLELTIIDRVASPIPHIELPRFLNRFEYYIDRKHIPSLSKTALEALACGLKVVNWKEEIVEGLPSEHKPDKVVNKLYKIMTDKELV